MRAVALGGRCSLGEHGRLGPQPHRAALVGDRLLLVQQADHRVRGVLVELGGVGPVRARRRCGRIRSRRTACPGRCRRTGCLARGRSGSPRPCPRCPVRRIRRARARRRSRPSSRSGPSRFDLLAVDALRCGPAPCWRCRRGRAPRRSTCRRRDARRTCPPRRC